MRERQRQRARSKVCYKVPLRCFISAFHLADKPPQREEQCVLFSLSLHQKNIIGWFQRHNFQSFIPKQKSLEENSAPPDEPLRAVTTRRRRCLPPPGADASPVLPQLSRKTITSAFHTPTPLPPNATSHNGSNPGAETTALPLDLRQRAEKIRPSNRLVRLAPCPRETLECTVYIEKHVCRSSSRPTPPWWLHCSSCYTLKKGTGVHIISLCPGVGHKLMV